MTPPAKTSIIKNEIYRFIFNILFLLTVTSYYRIRFMVITLITGGERRRKLPLFHYPGRRPMAYRTIAGSSMLPRSFPSSRNHPPQGTALKRRRL
jgi:hypothetical protein